jgi:hypothetical protein
VPLPPKVFQQPLRRDILHRCVVYYRSLLRQVRCQRKIHWTPALISLLLIGNSIDEDACRCQQVNQEAV